MAEQVENVESEVKDDDFAPPIAEAPARKPSPAPDITALAAFLRGPRAVPALAVVGIFLLGWVAFLYFARPFFLPVVLALMLHFLLKPVVRALAHIKVPEPIGAALVLVALLLGAGHAVSRLSQPAAEWAAKAPQSVRLMERKVREWLRPASVTGPAAEQPDQPAQPPPPDPTPSVHIQTSLADSLLSYTTSFLGGLLETIVLLYFFLASGDLLLNKLVKVLPTRRDKEQAIAIVAEVQHNISTFLFTITVINVCVALVVSLALYFLRMPNPVLWGALAGLLNFIPYFGPFTGVVILTLVGSVTFGSLGGALLPPVIYLGVHALESNFITPMVLGRRLTLNPVVIFISLIFWTWLWGVPGALLAVPLLMTLKIICDHFQPLASISEFLSH
jgi:predicted PurR-regulated permease PerM